MSKIYVTLNKGCVSRKNKEEEESSPVPLLIGHKTMGRHASHSHIQRLLGQELGFLHFSSDSRPLPEADDSPPQKVLSFLSPLEEASNSPSVISLYYHKCGWLHQSSLSIYLSIIHDTQERSAKFCTKVNTWFLFWKKVSFLEWKKIPKEHWSIKNNTA